MAGSRQSAAQLRPGASAGSVASPSARGPGFQQGQGPPQGTAALRLGADAAGKCVQLGHKKAGRPVSGKPGKVVRYADYL